MNRTSGEVSAEHVGESQSEERFISGGQTPAHDKLNITSGVLTTVTRGIVTERADTGVAVVASVAAITFAGLGTVLVPHLVIRVVPGGVLLWVDIFVVQATTVATAAIGAARAAASTALETIKAFAFACCVVAGTTAGAFSVHVEVGAFGVQRFEGSSEIAWRDRVTLRCTSVVFGVAHEASGGAQNNLLGVAIVQKFLNRSHRPGRSNWAVAVAAVTTEKAFVAGADITGPTGTMSTASVGAAGVGKPDHGSKSQKQLQMNWFS